MLKKVISGGQTGIDQLGLAVAKETGFETGGTAPKGFKTENGPMPELAKMYGLVESFSSDYTPRTKQNVKDSDGTVIFDYHHSTGSQNTIYYCKHRYSKPYIHNPTEEQLISFIVHNDIGVLNVAGNRGSKLSIFERENTRLILRKAFAYMKARNDIASEEGEKNIGEHV